MPMSARSAKVDLRCDGTAHSRMGHGPPTMRPMTGCPTDAVARTPRARLARRLAPPRGASCTSRSAHGRHGPGRRVGALARRTRGPVPRASPVAGPGRRARRVPGAPLAVRRPPPRRPSPSSRPRPPDRPRARAARPPQQRRRVAAFDRIGTCACRCRAASASCRVFWMRGYTGGLFLPLGDATNGVETYGAGRYLLDGRRARTSAVTRPRARSSSTQLRVPAVVRVRSAVGVPAGPAGEPRPRARRGRRAAALTRTGATMRPCPPLPRST